MIKNIIFDVGNVLLHYQPNFLLDEMQLDSQTKQTIMRAVFRHPIWLDCDRVVVRDEHLPEAFIANAPECESEIRALYDRIEKVVELMPHTIPWVSSLKERGYHLYVLSNYGASLFERTKHKMEFLPYMDGGIFSYECGVIKPDKAIYELLMKRYELEPSECVMLDDMPENVAGAIEAGMQAIRFVNAQQAQSELDYILNQDTEEELEA